MDPGSSIFRNTTSMQVVIINIDAGSHNQQNCRIVVDTHNRIISMEATKHIPKNDELFCDYGDMYVL